MMKSFLNKHLGCNFEEFKALGTLTMEWAFDGEQDQIFDRASATFLLGNKGTRNIIIDRVTHPTKDPKIHSKYHKYCIPWIRRSGWAEEENVENLMLKVAYICGDIDKDTLDKKLK